MTTADLAWLILFLPLLAAVIITLFTLRQGALSARLSIAAIVIGFVGSLILLGMYGQHPVDASTLRWIDVGSLKLDLGLRLDRLSLVMLLVVTGVGSLIHIYSFGYMHDDPGFGRYFASLSLFTFSMLGIVLANNFVMMFIFWELVGLSSYLLIGFWRGRPSAAEASKKAFITNRLGDFGFILGIILLWSMLGTVNFSELQEKLGQNPAALGQLSCVAGLLIFCGAMGKSAQFPLHVWLPDAMEGPTPVSALIHAATMVAAGVYMLCRSFFIFSATPAWPEALGWMGDISALHVIAWIGGITSLLAALIAVGQNDIKRILAYSTLSQLGLMVMAVGVGGPTPAMYHLTTHAFFKALLFLGAGSVIHGLAGEQNIWKMGGLKHSMPTTYWTFLVGTLALAGIPPLSGFYSKDEILAAAASHNFTGLFVIGTIVAILTTFYMFRLFFVAFTGAERTTTHAHESPGVMTWPLKILAVASILAGVWGIDAYLAGHFAGHAEHATSWVARIFAPFGHAPLAALAGLGAVIFGLSFAYAVYRNAAYDPLPEKARVLSRFLANRFYLDELWQGLISITHEALARLASWIDRWIIAGLGIRGLHGTTEIFGRALRLVQTGNLQAYAFLVVLGVAIILFMALRS